MNVVARILIREVRGFGDVEGADGNRVRFTAERTAVDNLKHYVGHGEGDRRIGEIEFDKLLSASVERFANNGLRHDDLLDAVSAIRRGIELRGIDHDRIIVAWSCTDNGVEARHVLFIL